jgi:hypothetical protein
LKEGQEYHAHRTKTHIWKWVAGVFLVILAILGGFALYLDSQWKPILTERIKETISSSSDSLYTIDFSDVDISLASGDVSFKNIVFKPDSAVYQRLKAEGKAPRHVYQVELDALTLQHVHPWKVYYKRELEMTALILNNPKVRVFFENVSEKPDTLKAKKTVYQHLSKYLKSLVVGSIILKDVNFKYIDRTLPDPEVAALENASVTIKDLRIDSASQHDTTRFYYTKDILVHIKDYKLQTKDKMYDVSFSELTASTASGNASLKDLKISPKYSDLTFSRKYKFQKDRYDMSFDEIQFNKVDFANLHSERQLIASSLEISGAKIGVFLNRELPFPPIDKGRNYPHVALKRLKLNTIIDTIRIRNAEINYTEYNPKTQGRGTVTFKRVNGTITNVTNDSIALKKNHWAKANISSLFMGESFLKVQINFNLTDPNAQFNYSGSMGPLNIRSLNKILRPLAMVEIKSGRVGKALFSVNGGYRSATGTLQLYYTDLKIGVLGKEEDNGRLKKKGLLSLVANALLITDNNPTPGHPLRVATGTFIRPDHGSFFNLMWKVIFDGITQSVGFTANREKELQKSFDSVKGSKPDRKERREERRQKREERRQKK